MAFQHTSRNGPAVAMPPFFNAFPVNGNDIATLFQLFNGEINNSSNSENETPAVPTRQAGRSHRAPVATVVNPRFDIRNDKESYHVSGELPGIEQKDINIEFSDDSTLLISGRTTVHEFPHAIDGLAIEALTSDEPEQETTMSRRASVEDVNDNDDEANQSSRNGAVVTTTEKNVTLSKSQQRQEQKQQQQQQHYLIRERSFGDFRRSFTFPSKVNQEAVKASLRNGVLSIVVPKAVASRRTIAIE